MPDIKSFAGWISSRSVAVNGIDGLIGNDFHAYLTDLISVHFRDGPG